MAKLVSPTNKQQAMAVVQAVERAGGLRSLSRQLNLNRDTLRGWLDKAKGFGVNYVRHSNATVKDSKVIEKNYEELEQQLAARVVELAAHKEQLDVYDQLANAKTYKISSYAPAKSNAVVVAVASDWHCGEAVDPSDLPGELNVYNPEIFVKRAEQFFQRIVFLTDNMARGVAKVDTLVLALLGDLMTGHLHDDQKESNHLHPMEELLLLTEVIQSGIDYLLKNGKFEKIIIPCCHGNHGRTTEKMRAKTSADTSYEVLLYKFLARHYKDNPKLEWKIAQGHHQMLKLWDYTIRFHHGDAVNYGGGVGGLTIPLRKAIAGWDSVQRADLSVSGHFHQLTDGGDFIVNGSLIGYNAYALRVKARYEPPQQAFFVVDQNRGKTMTARIFTDYMPGN